MTDKVFAGTVVLPDRIIDNGYVLVGDGMVQSVGSGALPAGEKHGGPEFLVLPGAIDAQVHSRSQLGQEDFVWSTRSAAAGGVTTIVDMPYDDNCLIATGRTLSHQGPGGGRAGARRFRALCARSIRDEGAARVDELVDAGAAALQVLDLRHASEAISAHSAAYALRMLLRRRQTRPDRRHPQRERRDGARLHGARSRPGASPTIRAHGLSRPPITEALATAEVYELGAGAGCPVHIVHCSIGRGYELAAAYRAQGSRRDDRGLHPLSDARRGERRSPPRRQGQDQSAAAAAPRGRSALASPRGRQRHDRLDRSRQLVGRPQDRSEHAQECLGHAGPGSAVCACC